MPQYAFRATDRMGNAVDGNVAAPDMSSATRQIQQMGYTPVSVQALADAVVTPPPPVPIPAAPVAAPPVAAGSYRRKPVDLTQPVTEMPEAAVDLFAPSTPLEPTQQIAAEAEPALANYQMPVPDAKTETTARFARLEPWERGGPLPDPPAPSPAAQPTTQMAAAGLGATQSMAAMGSIPERPGPGAPSRPQLVRGLENIPFGANSRREVSLFQRFQEVMIFPIFSGVVLKDLAPFYRQFATMLGAGLPLYQSLVALEANTKNARLKEVARNGARQVQAGGRFSDVLAAYPWIFPPLHLEMVRASEQGGMMDQVFRQIGDYVEHEIEIRRLINRETLYPKIVLFVLLMLMGRPGIFEGQPAIVELIAPDKMPGHPGYLADTVGFGLMILIPILVLVVFFRLFWFNIPSFRNSYDAFKLKIPVL
ncbi:MAG TPA: type II secretion system F family protein, partial [Chthonomonadaceae bacterium]|nr:type II secretion system F family protein [Chthonomonadaceae bacterium]